MVAIEKLHDINLRVADIMKQQQQLKTQSLNWEKLYKEATDVQKKLIEQSTEYAKRNDMLNTNIENLQKEINERGSQQQQWSITHETLLAENISLSAQLQTLTAEFQALKAREESQLSMKFGVEKEQELLKAINEDLQEQLIASQKLNSELQEELQALKITLVEEQAQANSVSQQKKSIEKEMAHLKENSQGQLSELHSKNSQLAGQMDNLAAENRQVRESLEAKDKKTTELEQQISALNAKMQDMEIQAAIAEEEKTGLMNEMDRLKASLFVIEQENDQLKSAAKTYEESIATVAAPESTQGSGSDDEQVRFLYAELQASQATNAELEKQIRNYIDIISNQPHGDQEPSLKNLEDQNKIVKLAQSIEDNTVASNMELRQKLNEMIKEVDRCIAKLSS
jgi:chromosome segregation ATPase